MKRPQLLSRTVGKVLLVLIFQCWMKPIQATQSELASNGHLLIVGGGLKEDNAEILTRFINLAGGRERARIGVLTMASASTTTGHQMIDLLRSYGLPTESSELLEMTVANATTSTADPLILQRIQRCTGLYFVGGDQRKITQVLLKPDGSDTTAMAAVRDLLRRGGVVGGTSAGAACLGELMFSSRGASIDTLDFGLSSAPHHRGAWVERGLNLFHAGILDQHFSHRGRIARLARVMLEKQVTYGFGIDEDTAIDVAPDQSFEVLGRGGVTILDCSEATASDSPSGYSAQRLILSYLEKGDRYDPVHDSCSIEGSRPRTRPGPTSERVVSDPSIDLSEVQAVRKILKNEFKFPENGPWTGHLIRLNGKTGHGYRFGLKLRPDTEWYPNPGLDEGRFSVLRIELEIYPTAITQEGVAPGHKPVWRFESPRALLPPNLSRLESSQAIESLIYRGILPTSLDRQFPHQAPITRSELALYLSRAVTLGPWRRRGMQVLDAPIGSPNGSEIAIAVETGILKVNEEGMFHPNHLVSRREFEEALTRAAALIEHEDDFTSLSSWRMSSAGHSKPFRVSKPHVKVEPLPTENSRDSACDPLTLPDAALSLAAFLGLPW